jgi:hypothetical protein
LPFGLYSSAILGIHERSILLTCCRQFFW